MNRGNFLFQAIGYACISAIIANEHVHAFGKKRQDPKPEPDQPVDTQAYPTRLVSLGKFYETKFMLPDGKTLIDMGVLLPELVVTELSDATRKLRVLAGGEVSMDDTAPTDGGEPSLPSARYVLRAGVTAFEADVQQYGIRFGYKPGVGDIGKGTKLTGAEGTVKVKIGELQMDFHIFDTNQCEIRNGKKNCAVVAYGKADAKSSQVNVDVNVDFSKYATAADFMYRSPMAPLFRKVARTAILEMVNNPMTNYNMDWQSQVTRIFPDRNLLFIGAGAFDEIQSSNVFEVYDGDGMFTGLIRIQNVEFEQSSATVKDDANGKIFGSIRVGDKVKIKKSLASPTR